MRVFPVQNLNQLNKRNLQFLNNKHENVETETVNLDTESDEVSLSAERKEERVPRKKVFAWLGAIGITSFILFGLTKPGKKKKPSKQLLNLNTKQFHSLMDNPNIPRLEDCKSLSKKLKNFLQLQLNFAQANEEIIQRTGVKNPPNKFLMWGPPGTGKSFFAKIFAKTLDADYMEILTSDIDGNAFAGIGVEKINSIFDYIIKQAQKNPQKKFVVTINEIDSLILPLESLTSSIGLGGHTLTKIEERSALINCIDRLTDETCNVTLIGTTNKSPFRNGLDSAILSRFMKKIGLNFPEKELLHEALIEHMKKFKGNKEFIEENKENLDVIAQKLYDRKCSFRDLDNIVDLSKNYYLEDILYDSSAKYKFDYLEKGFKDFEITDGELAGNIEGKVK